MRAHVQNHLCRTRPRGDGAVFANGFRSDRPRQVAQHGPVFGVQDGKDYIPLSAMLAAHGGFPCSAPTPAEDFFKQGVAAPRFHSGSSSDVR